MRTSVTRSSGRSSWRSRPNRHSTSCADWSWPSQAVTSAAFYRGTLSTDRESWGSGNVVAACLFLNHSRGTMTGTPPVVMVSLLTRMLVEAFEGPPGPWTYFTDASPGTGLFATINGLSAAQASERGGPGHTTIAGHIHHVSESLVLSTLGLRGQATSRDPGRSWTGSTVDDA